MPPDPRIYEEKTTVHISVASTLPPPLVGCKNQVGGVVSCAGNYGMQDPALQHKPSTLKYGTKTGACLLDLSLHERSLTPLQHVIVPVESPVPHKLNIR